MYRFADLLELGDEFYYKTGIWSPNNNKSTNDLATAALKLEL